MRNIFLLATMAAALHAAPIGTMYYDLRPNGDQVAYWQTDTHTVPIMHRISAIASGSPEPGWAAYCAEDPSPMDCAGWTELVDASVDVTEGDAPLFHGLGARWAGGYTPPLGNIMNYSLGPFFVDWIRPDVLTALGLPVNTYGWATYSEVLNYNDLSIHVEMSLYAPEHTPVSAPEPSAAGLIAGGLIAIRFASASFGKKLNCSL